MRILAMGLDRKGNRLFPPLEETAMQDALLKALVPNTARVQRLARSSSGAAVFRGEQSRRIVDRGDPKTAGWTFLVADKDPRKKTYIEALAPLAKARGMDDPKSPLLFDGSVPDAWPDWLNDRYYALDLAGKKVPGYVLIVGGPDQVPFGFQSLLDTVASVGRLDFDRIEDLSAYAAKVLRLESASNPVVEREALFYATDGGDPDPTYFSRKYMAEPLAASARQEHKVKVTEIFGDAATKANLLAALRKTKAALVYTASHGLGATSESQQVQAKYNGAICCQHDGPLTLDHLLSADDIPSTDPMCEGAVVFQFACYGYGTPAQSEYAHWLPESWGKAQPQVPKDFVAALPKKLLANPRGPIAFIGHLDTAFLHGFADPHQPYTVDRWSTRIVPFKRAVDQLLGVQPSGLAMEGINERYAVCNAMITNASDRVQRGTMNWTEESKRTFLDTWITRGDAQNYFLMGDPAARLRIPN
jgi:Peptidase family C25